MLYVIEAYDIQFNKMSDVFQVEVAIVKLI